MDHRALGRLIRIALLGPTLLLPLACEPAPTEEPPATFTTTDSAGVTLASSAAPAWEAEPAGRWTIDAEPVLDLTESGSGPAHEFQWVTDGTVLSDGRIVVADGRANVVRAYSAEGEAVASHGREGEGPEEYNSIRHMIRFPGDTLGVFSWPTKLTILAPDLSFVRTSRIGELTRDPQPLPSGELTVEQIYATVTSYDYSEGNRLIRGDHEILRVSADGEIRDTLWRGPGPDEFMFVLDEQNRGAMAPLFGRSTNHVTRGASIIVGTSDRMEFQVLDRTGALTGIIRVPDYDLTLPDSVADAEIAARLGPDPSPMRRRMTELLPVPDRRPAYSELAVDSEGYLWAAEPRTFQGRYRPLTWQIFDPDGRWMGAVSTPANFEVFEIGRDWILGAASDELDVQHVQLLRLNRGGGEK